MDNTYLLGALGGLGLICILFLALSYIDRRHKPLGESDNHPQKQNIETDFILEAIEDGVMMAEKDNRVHLFNPAAARITGWPQSEAVGMDYKSVLPLIDDKGQVLNELDHPFGKALAAGQSVHDSHALLATRSGKPLPISLIVSPVLDDNGHASGPVVGVFRDTAKEAEEEQQRSDFISTASHEMRTPLAAIEGYLALALNPKTARIDENAQHYLEKASSSTKHLGELFRDLLTSSKAEDGRIISYPMVTEVGEILDQVTEAARFNAKSKDLELQFAISSDSKGGKTVRPLYYAYVDPNRLREVFQNIIDNAIKYTTVGSVTVRLTGDTKIVQIQVIDTGAGIPTEDIPHLFQKFYRVDNSTTRTIGGTGLGLYISRKIMELYNGRIWVESEIDKGSNFFINLPRLNSQQALEMQQKQAYTVSPNAQRGLDGQSNNATINVS